MPALRNPRTGSWLARDLQVARSPWARGLGLMFRRSLPEGRGLLLPRCNSIHSFFMRFPFDAVFVDKRWTVLRTMEAIPPARICPIVWRADAVIELPAGVIAKTETRPGDHLELLTPNS